MLVDPLKQLSMGAAVLYEMTGSGVATAFKISGWRPMTIEQFKNEIVPTLQPSQAEGKFHYYVLRDLANSRYLTVYPDGVIDYKVEEVVDAPAADVVQALIEDAGDDNTVETVINSSLPVYGFKEGTTWSLSVKIPETRFLFRNSSLFANTADAPYVYMPPVIFKIVGRQEHIINRYVWLLAQDSISEEFVKKAKLPLPNVWSDGKICVGRTAALNEKTGKPSKMQLLMQAWDLFINSDWNFDLLCSTAFPDNLDTVYTACRNPDSNLVKMAETSVCELRVKKLLQLLEILKEPGRWEQLNWVTI